MTGTEQAMSADRARRWLITWVPSGLEHLAGAALLEAALESMARQRVDDALPDFLARRVAAAAVALELPVPPELREGGIAILEPGEVEAPRDSAQEALALRERARAANYDPRPGPGVSAPVVTADGRSTPVYVVPFDTGDGRRPVLLTVTGHSGFLRDGAGLCAFCHGDPFGRGQQSPLIVDYLERNPSAGTCPCCRGLGA